MVAAVTAVARRAKATNSVNGHGTFAEVQQRPGIARCSDRTMRLSQSNPLRTVVREGRIMESRLHTTKSDNSTSLQSSHEANE